MNEDTKDVLRAMLDDFRAGKLSQSDFKSRIRKLTLRELSWLAQESKRRALKTFQVCPIDPAAMLCL